MKKIATLIAIPALVATANAAFITIDDFNDGSFNITQTGSVAGGNNTVDSTHVVTTGTGMIGGEREARAHNVSGTGNNNVNNDVNAGQFTWSQDSNATGHFHLYYGTAATNGTATQLNADFSTVFGVVLNVISSDIGGLVKITLSMNNGASVWSNTETVPADVGGFGPSSPFALYFDIGGFTQDSGGALNLSDVDGITIEAAAEYTSADWRLDSIETVPEPSSTVLLGLSGAALLLRRRRA